MCLSGNFSDLNAVLIISVSRAVKTGHICTYNLAYYLKSNLLQLLKLYSYATETFMLHCALKSPSLGTAE